MMLTYEVDGDSNELLGTGTAAASERVADDRKSANANKVLAPRAFATHNTSEKISLIDGLNRILAEWDSTLAASALPGHQKSG